MRLIDADACYPYFYDHLDDRSMAGAQNAIDDMPTIDAEPVRHGQWEHYKTMHNIVCSVCKSHRPYKKTERGYHVVWNANYCPNCGTKMEEDAN